VLQDSAYQAAWGRALEAAAPLLKGAVVLDVGCGLGTLAMAAAKVRGKHVAQLVYQQLRNCLANVLTAAREEVTNVKAHAAAEVTKRQACCSVAAVGRCNPLLSNYNKLFCSLA
jgi:cyclopropane fatty-acyl-phospholipid synthase-like methyltransferase